MEGSGVASTLIRLAPLVVTLAVAGVLLRGHLARRPRRGTALVRVPAEVVSQHPLTTLWTIRYPLPDGTPHELRVQRTIPEMLYKGMAVAVLVDPDEPTRARLDLPERARFIKVLLITVFGVIALGFVVAGAVAALLSSLD